MNSHRHLPTTAKTSRRRFRLSTSLAAGALALLGATPIQALDQTWGANANTAWYTTTNWLSGTGFPGLQGVAASNTDIATFTSAATATTFGINMGTASLNLGAISIDSTRTIATSIGNSSTTGGFLRLYGATVNGVANVILRNNSTGLLTLQATQGGTMGVVLSNTTNNIINIDNTGGVTISSIISESVAGNKLTKGGAGTGTLTLTGANTYTGATSVTTGTLSIGTGGSIAAASPISISAGAVLTTSVNNSFSGAPSGAWTIAGTITGTGNAQTMPVAVTLNNGTMSGTLFATFGTFLTQGSLTTTITANGATNTISAGNFGLSASSILSLNTPLAADAINVTSQLGGTSALAGALSKAGLGTVTLNTAGTYTGATTVSAGVLNIRNATALGTVAAGTTVTSGAALEIQNNIAVGAEALSIAGGGNGGANLGALRNISGNNTWGGTVTMTAQSRINSDSGTLTLNNATASVTGAFNLVVGGAGNVTISTPMTNGTGGVSKDGAGTLTLSGANTYTGAVAISAGAVTVSNALGLGTVAGGVTVASGSALQLSTVVVGAEALSLNGTGIAAGGALRNLAGTSSYAGAITLAAASRINSDAGTLTLSGGITGATFGLTVGGAGNTTISSIIGTTSGTLTKDGAGTLTLSAANTYTGATAISAGAVTVSNAAGLGTTAAGTSVTSGAALQLSTVVVGAEALTLNGTGISSGGALRNLAGTSSLSGAITLGSASRINTDAGTLTLSGAMSGAFGLTVGGASNTTISGAIGAAVTSLIKDGAGALTLSGTNLYGGTSSATGGVLSFATTLAIPGYSTSPATAFGTFASPRISAASGATVAFPFGAATNAVTTTDITGFLDGTYGIFAAGSSLGIDTTNASPSPANLTTVITNTTVGQLGFTKMGTNALTVNSANTYTGPTAIVNGTLNASVLGNVGAASSSLGAQTTIPLATVSLGLGASTGTLSYTGAGETTDRVVNLAGLTGGGGLDNSGLGTVVYSSPITFTGAGAKTLTISGVSNTTLGSALLGGVVATASPLTLAKTGAGTFLLNAPGAATNTNTVTNLSIAGGILDIGTSGLTISNLGATVITVPTGSANVTINGTGGGVLTISSFAANGGGDIRPAAGTTLTINAVVNTPVTNTGFWTGQGGALELNDAGTLVLTNTNTIGGNVIITAAGTISVGSIANNLGGATGFIFSTAGSRLLYTGSGETTALPLTINANSTLDMSGTGTLILSAASVTVTAATNKTFTLQGSTAGTGVLSGIIPNIGANTTGITKAGTGTWTLSGANTFTGATTVNGGNLILTTGTTANSAVTINNLGTLSILGNYTVGNAATAAAGGSLTLAPGGVVDLADGAISTLTLTQNATFATAGAAFNGGLIKLDVSGAAADLIASSGSLVGSTSSGGNGIVINPIAGFGVSAGAYTIISGGAGSGSISNANFYLASSTINVGGSPFTLALSQAGPDEQLTITAGASGIAPGAAYWAATTDSSWGTQPGGAGTATNWFASPTGPDSFSLPGALTNVRISANTLGVGTLTTTLDVSYIINSLAFTGAGTANTAGSSIAGVGASTLTINAAALNGNTLGNGITVNAGSGANSITAPVVLGASQSWTSNASTATTVSNVVSEGASTLGLTIAGTGTGGFILSNAANTYAGPTTINGSVLSVAVLDNGGLPSGIGQSSSAATNLVFGGSGTLQYTGGSISNDRNFTINAGNTAIFDVANPVTNLTLVGATGVTTGLLTKTGTGTLTLSGANAYTGATAVNAGTLRFSGTMGASAITANNAGSVIQIGAAAGLTSLNAVSITAGTTLDLNGFSVTTGALTTVATSTITNTSSSTSPSTATAIGTPSGVGVYVDALTVSPATAAAVTALITDGATRKTQIILNNVNAGIQVTNNTANTFSGGIVLANNATGTRLTVGIITGTPFGTGPIIIGQAATDKAGIFFGTAGQTLTNPIVFNTALGTDRVGIRGDLGLATLSGVITANLAPATFTSNTTTGAGFLLTNQVTGAFGLVLDIVSLASATTSFNVTLNGPANVSDYAGDTVVNFNATTGKSATLNLGAANQIPNGAGRGNVVLNTTGTGVGLLNLASFSETINGLNGSGTVEGGISGTPTLTVGDGNAAGSFSGIIQNTGSTLALTKIGGGTQILSGTNTYAGLTSVNGGTLSFSTSANLGNAAATNGVTLGGGTLQYTGGGALVLGASRQVTLTFGTAGTIEVQNGAGNLQVTAGGIITTGASAATNFTKTGPGILTVSGIQAVDLQTGGVTVTGGTLIAGLHATNTGTITVGSSGSLQLVDASPVNLTLAGTGLGALTLTGGLRLGFELDATTVNDSITMTGANAATASGVITLDFYALGGFGGPLLGNYTLLTAPGGLLGASYVLGNAPSGFNYVITPGNTSVTLQTSLLSNIYWTNSQADGKWSALNGVGPFTSNFSTDLPGLNNTGQLPQTMDTVIFSSSAGSVGASPINTTLETAFTVDSLRFTAQPAGAMVSIAPGAAGTLNLSPVSTANGITVDLNGGAVDISAPLTAGTTQTWSVDGTGLSSLALSGNVTYTGNVTKAGAGALTLTGPANTGSGSFTLAGGTLNANSNGALGTGTFTIGTGTTIENSSAGLVTLTGGANVWNGNFTYTGGTQSLDLGTGAVALGASLQVTVSGSTLTAGGALTDGASTFGLTKAGAGTLVLNGNNNYDGTTTLSIGTLTLGGNNTLSGAIIANSGTLNMSGNNALTGAVTVNAGATANLTGNNAFGALVTVNGGILNLNGANTGAGGVTLASGVLNLNNDAALGAGRLTLSGGTISSPLANRLTTNSNVQTWTNGATVLFTDANTLDLGVGAVTFGADATAATFTLTNNSTAVGTTLTVGGDITSGAGGLAGVKTLIINGSNTGTTLLSGNLSAGAATGLVVRDSLAVGGTLKLTGTSTIQTLNITPTGGIVDLTGGNLSLSNLGATILLASNNATINGGTITLTSGTAGTAAAQGNYGDFGATGGTLTVNSVIAGAAGIGVDYFPIGGNIVLTGTNTYSGPSDIYAASVSVSTIGDIGVPGNLGTAGTLGTNAAAILIGNGTANSILKYTGLGETNNRTIALSATTGTSTIDMSGAGTLRFSATGNILSPTAGAKTLALQGSTAGIGQLDQNIVNATNGGASVSLSKAGTGTWLLTGNSTYTGTTTITAGTLSIDGAGSLGAAGTYAGAIANAGTLIYNSSATQTFSGAVTGVGALTKSGAGNLTLSSATTAYTGATSLTNGTLVLTNTTAFASPVTVNTGTTLQFSPTALNAMTSIGAISLVGTLTYAPAGIFHQVLSSLANNKSVTVSGGASVINISPGGAFTTGNGGLYLDGGLKGSSALTINATTNGYGLSLRNGNTTYSGTLTVNGTASTIAGTGSGLTIGSATGSPTGLSSANLTINGTLELGDSTAGMGWAASSPGAVTGTTVAIDALNGTGVIVGNMATAASTRILSVGNNGGTGNFSGVIANGTNDTLSFTKAGVGTQTLSGLSNTASSNYSGTTTIDNGNLTLSTTSPTLTGGLTFGAAAGNTTTSTLDLSGVASSATFTGVATVRTNSTTANTIALAGQTLTLNGGLTVGYAASAGTATTTKLTTTGAGSLAVNGTSLIVGVDGTGAVNSAWFNQATLDVSGLASFSTNVTNFNIGSGVNVVPTGNVLLSNTANTILATTLVVGNTGGANGDGTSTLTLGTGTNIINADTIQIGRGKASGPGVLKFASQTAGSPGTVTIANKAGTGPTAIDIGNNNGTGTAGGAIGTLDLRGHVATVNASTVTLGNNNNTSTGSTSGTLSFDAGNFTVATLTVAPKTAAGVAQATGMLNIGGGTFTVNTAFTLGSQATAGTSVATLNLTGGTFNSNVAILQGGGSTTSTINLDGSTAILDVTNNAIGGANAVTLNAKQGTLQNLLELNGGGTLTKSTGGTLILTGTNGYTGLTDVTAGIVRVTSATGLGTAAGGTTVTALANLQIENLNIGGENLTLNGTGIAATGALTATGAAASSGTVTLASTSSIGVATLGDTLTLSGAIGGGASGLTKVGAGELILSGALANTYTGLTTVNQGALTLNKTGVNAIAGPGGAVKGDLAAILVNGGTLNWGASDQVGNNTRIDITGGAIAFNTFNETIWDLVASGGSVDYGTGTVTILDPTWSGATNTISGTTIFGVLNVSAGLNTINAGASLTVGSSGGLNFQGTGTTPNITVNSSAGTSGVLKLAGDVTVDSTVTSASITSGLALANLGRLDLNGAPRTFNVADGTDAVDLLVSASIGNGALIKAGAGNLMLTGDNTFSSGLTINGGTLLMGNANAIGNPANPNTLTMTGGTLDANGFVAVVVSLLSGTGGVITDSFTTTPGTTTLSSSSITNDFFAGAINDGTVRTLSYVKNGSGTLSLTNTGSTYSGLTAINGGKINVAQFANINTPSSLGTGSLLGQASDLILVDGTLQYTGSTAQSTDRLFSVATAGGTLDASGSNNANPLTFTGTGAIGFGATTGPRTLTLTGTNTGGNSLAAVIGDEAAVTGVTSLTKTGPGAWTLTGTNSYTGATLISTGTLQLGNGSLTGSLSPNSAITDNGTLIFNRSNAVVQGTDFANNISGPGSVEQAGSGTTTFNVANSYLGGTTLSGGTLVAGHDNAFGSTGGQTVTFNGGKLVSDNDARSLPNNLVVNNVAGNQITGSNSLTLTGNASGLGTLQVNTDSTKIVTLNSATLNGFAPNALDVKSGTLLLGGADKIGDSTAMVASGGTFNTGGFNETLSTLTLSANSTIDFGASVSAFLTFADAGSTAWTGTLSIWNWSGVPFTGGGTDRLLLTSSATNGNIVFSNIQFFSDNGINAIGSGSSFIPSGLGGEIVPVPEPSSIATVMGLLGLMGWRERRKARQSRTAERRAIG